MANNHQRKGNSLFLRDYSINKNDLLISWHNIIIFWYRYAEVTPYGGDTMDQS